MSLAELQALETRYLADLKEEIDFWLGHGVDHEHGGFICGLKHDGERLTTNKFVWFQGRGLWVFSYLFQHANELPFATDNDPSDESGLKITRRTTTLKRAQDKRRSSPPQGGSNRLKPPYRSLIL